MSPGSRKGLESGVRIEYLEYANETAKVNFIFQDQYDIEENEIPVDFPEKLLSTELSEDHNGLWYNDDFYGQGFDVQVRNNKLLVYWYTFNEKNDSRRFYFGSCDLAEGTETFDLYTTDSGTFDDPTTAKAIKAGRGQLYFFDKNNGVFNYNTDEHGRGSVEITPIAFSQHDMSGVWYNPERNYEGFSIQFFDQLNSCTAFWYTYGPKTSSSSISKQRWFMCNGSKVSDTEYDLTIYEVTGGRWMFFDDVVVKSVGTAKLTIIDSGLNWDIDSKLKIDYDIAAEPGVTGKGTFDLTRLF